MQCPNCNTENRDGAKFCDECGFPLVDVVTGEEITFDDGEFEEREFTSDYTGDEVDATLGDESEESSEIERILEVDDEFTTQKMPAVDESEDEDQDQNLETAVKAEDEEVDASSAEDTSDDLSGFETAAEDFGERLVDSSYEKPEPNWRDGNTIQMKPVEGKEPEKSKDYLASSTTKQKRGKKGIVIAIVAIVVAVAAILLATFQMNVWGGKPVPDVKGMTEADARSVLEGENFIVRSSQVKSDDTEGLVLITDPEAGARVNEGDEVVIHIAAARMIPDVVGKQQADAATALVDEGYENVKFISEPSEQENGTVVRIEPNPGTHAKSTAEVTVYIAAPFTVPDVSNQFLDDAIATLEEAGFIYEVIYIPTDDYAPGQMIGTVPMAGTEVEKGSVVVIQIAQSIATMMENSASAYLAPGTTIVSNGYSFTIDSVNSVSYVGNNTVQYSATGRAFTQMLSGENVYDSPTTITGTLTMSSDGQVLG